MLSPCPFPNQTMVPRGTLCGQVRTWGILWRPMEIGLDRVKDVMSSIVRLHNLCRRSRAKVHPAMGVSLPKEVRFNSKGRIEGDLFETVASLGRPATDMRGPREAIRSRIEALTLMRPRWNLDRHKDKWPVVCLVSFLERNTVQ